MTLQTNWQCPSCHKGLHLEGEALKCSNCNSVFSIHHKVYRFLQESDIAKSFGFQWRRFPKVQLDSFSLDSRSRERFSIETGWGPESLKGKLVLDAGCGSGRFAEIALSLGAQLVMVDASEAIIAAEVNLGSNPRSTFVKADLSLLPFKNQTFDYVYCLGVLQHTMNPFQCIQEVGRVTKLGGEVALTFYEYSGWWTLLYSKYLIRPITRKIPKSLLLRLIKVTSLLWYPLTNLLFRLPGPLDKFFRFIIPVANYVDFKYSRRQLQRTEAILDTFDMLSPEYDTPLKKSEVIRHLISLGFAITDSSIKGNVKAKKIFN